MSVGPLSAPTDKAVHRPPSGRPASRIPFVLYLPATLAAGLLVLPLVALLVRADWARIPAAITSDTALQALRLSLITATSATVVCLILGVPLAVVLARRDGPVVRVLRALTTLPLVLPPLVGGIALLYLLGVRGLLGQYLYLWFDIRIAFTTLAVVLAQTFVALPFLVLSLEGALRSVGTGYDTVAATLGAGGWTVFRRVTIPLVGPGLLSATVLCFSRALGEFGATALFAGNQAGVTRTMPLAIYTAFNGSAEDQDAAIAMSLLLVLVAVVILVLVQPRRLRDAA